MPPRPQKRKNARPSRCVAKRRKVEPSPATVDRIGDTVALVAGGTVGLLTFSDVNSPASSSNAASPLEERVLPSENVTVPEISNSTADNREEAARERVVPRSGDEAINTENQNGRSRSENGNREREQFLSSDVIQEAIAEIGRIGAARGAIGRIRQDSASNSALASLVEAPQGQIQHDQLSQDVGQNPASAPMVSQEGEDPWIAALDDIAPPSRRTGYLSITHNMPPFSTYEIDMMEDLKLPDDVGSIQYPKVGNVQLLKLVDEAIYDGRPAGKIYDGLDLLHGRFVTVRQLERQKHMRRLRLACRLSFPSPDMEEFKRIYELLIPAKTTFVLRKEKTTEEEAKLYYYWIEPPHHGSLHAYVIERKRLTEVQTKEYFRQICQIVEFCHARGVIIRDLKLRKFVFADARRQTVKLDDLDETAICPENKADPDLIDYDTYDVEHDRICDRHGCPAYVSPEILDLSKKWYSGKAADVWSLGVLLYVLSVGRYPFYDMTPAGLFTKIRQARVHLSEQDGVRLEVRLLIRCMLRRDPKERPSVAEVLANPWLKPKDYRSSFQVFDSSESVFWRSSDHREAPGGASASTSDQPMTSSALMRINGIAVQQPTAAPRVAQRDVVVGGTKVVERLNLVQRARFLHNAGNGQGGRY